MTESKDVQRMRSVIALLRITLGIIILVTWYENLTKEPVSVYSADGIRGLFNYIFNENGGGPGFYRAIIQNTILQAPGIFAVFQLVAELLMGLGLLVGALTPWAAAGATLFFFNLFLAYLGGNEWIWIYVLLTVSAFVVMTTRAGRALGFDGFMLKTRGKPPLPFMW